MNNELCVTDTLLVQRLQQGDLTALGELYETHKNLVYRTAMAITRDERAAEDILQECFVRLHLYAGSVDTQRPLKPWLYRVTVNLAYDWAAARRPFVQSLDEVIELISGAFPAPDRKTEEKESQRMVHAVIGELPATHRAVIALYYLENLSVESIAGVLELPVGTVKSRLYYARERLREILTLQQRPVPEMSYEFT